MVCLDWLPWNTNITHYSPMTHPSPFSPDATLTIVTPVYNESETLFQFFERLRAVMDETGHPWTVLFVDDGSVDESVARIESLQDQGHPVELIVLSRNFGKEIAMTAGLDHCDSDAVIVIDSDLQDPPEVIPELLASWREGFEVVYAQRERREGESWMKRLTAAAFYRTINLISRTPIPVDTGDFRLLSRKAYQSLGLLRERNRFMKGLFSWIGFRQKGIRYVREQRFAGTSKFNYWRLWNFAIDGVTSFTTAPLRMATYLGLCSAAVALIYAVWVIIKTLFIGESVPGYPSLMVVILFLGGVQLISIGIIGEYLGRLFEESKHRPLYLISQTRGVGQNRPVSPDQPAD